MKKNVFYPGFVLLALTLSLTACDFLDNENSAAIVIGFPSALRTYLDNDQITYTLADGNVTIGGNSTTFNGTLTMDWDNTVLTDVLNATSVPLVQFNTTEVIDAASISATQFITQPAVAAVDEGSVTLHAFRDAFGNDFWVDTNDDFTTNEAYKILFSPFQADINTAGQKGIVQPFNFKVMGNCNATICEHVATVTGSFTVADEQLQLVTVPAGKFETYKINYNYIVTPIIGVIDPPVIDFRSSCVAADTKQTATVLGDMNIFPNIGPVRISNRCSSTGAGLSFKSYTALLTKTTISF